VAPAEAVMLGDTPYDVQAARAAGVGCVALRSGGWTDEHFGDALAVYDDPADLLAHYDASPFGTPRAAAAAS
jgi:phosphoglycolate phosphatase-like HAD superfamily hydrolase